MLIQRLRHPRRAARALRTWSGDWWRARGASDREPTQQKTDVSEVRPPLPSELEARLETVERQLRDLSEFPAAPSSHVSAVPPGVRGMAGPVVHGNVSGVGLGTLFNLFENERLAGLLTLRGERRQLDFLFREGGIVRCELDASTIAASDGVREACKWRTAEFNFRRDLLDEEVDAPRSANVLLLDALRQQDERVAAR